MEHIWNIYETYIKNIWGLGTYMKFYNENLPKLSLFVIVVNECELSEFLRRSLMIFIIKGFLTIVFIFIVIYTTFRPICPSAFFRCLSNSGTYMELRTLLNQRCRLFWFRLNLQPPDDCLLREPTPITVTLCVLLESLEWIFGTYKLNVLTWLDVRVNRHLQT